MQIEVSNLLDRNGQPITPAPTLVAGDVGIAIDGVTFVDLVPLPTAQMSGRFTIDIDGVTPSTVIIFQDQEDTSDPDWQQEWLDLTIQNITDDSEAIATDELTDALQPLIDAINGIDAELENVTTNTDATTLAINSVGVTLSGLATVSQINDSQTGTQALINTLQESIDKIPARGNGTSQRRLLNEAGQTLKTIHEVIDDDLTGV